MKRIVIFPIQTIGCGNSGRLLRVFEYEKSLYQKMGIMIKESINLINDYLLSRLFKIRICILLFLIITSTMVACFSDSSISERSQYIDDHSDTFSFATDIAIDSSASGSIEIVGDVDYFSFNATAGHINHIWTEGIDTVISLYGIDGETVIMQNNGPDLYRTLSPTGKYYVCIKHQSLTSTGGYTIHVNEEGLDDHSDTFSFATEMAINSSASGSIEIGGDVDYFSFNATAGHINHIWTEGIDTVITLYGIDGEAVIMQNNGPDLYRTLSPTGKYYVCIKHQSLTSTGGYTIHVDEEGLDDHSDTFSFATDIAIDSSASGSIEIVGDVDYFFFNATAGYTYHIWTEGIDTVITLYGIDGETVIMQNNGPDLYRTLSPTGKYYVCIKHQSLTSTGGYTIHVNDEGLEK